ncbi:MAG: hypothetical protein HZB12_00775, partial [Candidatus Yonathbacteria bacterium]|nr:hypothetical protein [Candidatus Yonathbacteria bacterium]
GAKSDAKERIIGALIGLGLILTSWLILNSINPNLVNFNLNLPAVGETVATAPPAGGAQATWNGTGINTSTLSGGGANPALGTAVALGTVVSSVSPVSAASAVAGPSMGGATVADAGTIVADLGVLAQSVFNSQMNKINDHSIIEHCKGNITEPLCNKTHLIDGINTTDADVISFINRAYPLDANSNGTLELEDSTPAAAKSCFFKFSTASIPPLLPHQLPYYEWDMGSWYLGPAGCGGSGITQPPSSLCGGNDGWLSYSKLGGVCAVDNGFLGAPFGFVYMASGMPPTDGGMGGQYSDFKTWVTGASSGNTVNLSTLFVRTFLSRPSTIDTPTDPYLESTIGKITYATVAQYDLNNDGIADFGAGGADMVAFNACKGGAVSGVCAQADFNGDSVIDDRDLSFVKFMRSEVLNAWALCNGDPNNPTTCPLGRKLNYFESMFFDPSGYTDKQIIMYCLGRIKSEKCIQANVDQDTSQTVNSADLNLFNSVAPTLDFNGDGKVDLYSI